MIEESIKIRVRYSETDQMGFVYYGNYAQYLEMARVAAIKKIGLSYKEMEERGVGMPVREMKISYKKAAKYDDEIKVVCFVKEIPSAKMTFYYSLYRGSELLCTAETILFFMELKTLKVCRAPQFLVSKMSSFFN